MRRCAVGLDKERRWSAFAVTLPDEHLANDRVQCNAAGQVELKFKTPWRDGTTHQVMIAAGVHATLGGAGAKATVASDPPLVAASLRCAK
jgi:hypothetical protein